MGVYIQEGSLHPWGSRFKGGLHPAVVCIGESASGGGELGKLPPSDTTGYGQ